MAYTQNNTRMTLWKIETFERISQSGQTFSPLRRHYWRKMAARPRPSSLAWPCSRPSSSWRLSPSAGLLSSSPSPAPAPTPAPSSYSPTPGSSSAAAAPERPISAGAPVWTGLRSRAELGGARRLPSCRLMVGDAGCWAWRCLRGQSSKASLWFVLKSTIWGLQGNFRFTFLTFKAV